MGREEPVALIEKMLRLSLEIGDGWVSAQSIQREFHRRYGSPIYKPAMDDLRTRLSVEHRYVTREPKHWEYRLIPDTSAET